MLIGSVTVTVHDGSQADADVDSKQPHDSLINGRIYTTRRLFIYLFT